MTDRELEVLRLVAKGWTNARIALELDVTERTVRFHLESLFARLEVDNRVEAVVKAIRLGWLDVSE
ncbi:MAG: LuxR C-terminal-related transcriptional regulator [Chloroflexota bacterium]|nr:LuxR C-terminal-related transcriptional regulator [Chloroflexota bacterium]